MEDAFTLGAKLKEEALHSKEQCQTDVSWQMLRSDIYVRDKGICWICNTYVELKDYDLGHLVDRCNGGKDEYDNLAVMHKSCNLSKPKHNTLEEAMKWKLTPKYLSERPVSMFDNSKSIGNGYPYHKKKRNAKTSQLLLPTDSNKTMANNQLINSYFQAHPELSDTTNTVRLEAIKLLSQILNLPEKSIQLQPPKQNSPILQLTPQPVIKVQRKINQKKLINMREKYNKILEKIVPGTLCWIQGRPLYTNGYAPMWKIAIPPYSKDDMFTIRITPTGAIDNGKNGIYDTLQIINGELTKEVILVMGSISYHISQKDGKLNVITIPSSNSNTGERSQTIGSGVGQIPIEAWKTARAQGIPLKEFKETYWKQLANS